MPRGKSIGLSISELERMLAERRSAVGKLNKQRADLQKKLDTIDREIAKLGGSVISRRFGGGRARNAMSLVEAMASALNSKEAMRVGDIVDAVQANGYHSSSANFRGIVNQTLIKEKKRFASAGRGLYLLKK
jgi:hypothetical protein